jgi:methyltransferase-like protein 22
MQRQEYHTAKSPAGIRMMVASEIRPSQFGIARFVLDVRGKAREAEIVPSEIEGDDHEDPETETIKRPRRAACVSESSKFVVVSAQPETTVFDVGFQVWRASFLLADALIDGGLKYMNGPDQDEIEDYILFELGCGVGLIPISLAASALDECTGRAIFTDRDQDIVDRAQTNFINNCHLYDANRGGAIPTGWHFKALDWSSSAIPCCRNCMHGQQCRGSWGPELCDTLRSHRVLFVAADVVYDDDLTDAFFSKMSSMGKSKDKILVSLEKRFNFEIDSMEVVAHGYKRFVDIVSNRAQWDSGASTARFHGVLIDMCNIPKYYTEYSRSDSLELWEITIL